MNTDYEKRLEERIHRELNELPELPAPPTLASRVMAAIARQAQAPWYRQSWQMWPLPVRAASFVLWLALVAALCFGLWKLPQVEGVAATLHQVAGWFSWLSVVWNVVSAVLSAAVLVVKQLGTGFFIACVLVIGLGWAFCIGLGTVYFRLALARR
ncbi:MAG TPA: hypothetical protein VN578_18840 [Candidatus Binatia bacterium]|jgi:hypothetical protein|nr:hypothetical protein [Candidatus Binatia bacterium]